MSRYFFHLVDGGVDADREGSELPSLQTAKQEAVRLAGAMMRDDPALFLSHERWSVEVSDEDGLPLFSLNIVATEAQGAKRLSAG